ncbi:uncharacterized protein LOC126738699 isoform X2 [Anthonomus grandis grandis]|uniref:uncharacterized protein LOC126738699 isoform X2 n=1 Tax=Anthonomus grandis grandis TaxID=2921223 RepID=UPI002166068D|nr:uncharacterized protein LOC126738699 isoform X2 [Anthonomus grandis grandis]
MRAIVDCYGKINKLASKIATALCTGHQVMSGVTKFSTGSFSLFSQEDSTKTERIVAVGPRNSRKILLKEFGRYSALSLELDEYALNKQILRIPLPKVDITKLSARQVANRFRTEKTEKKRKRNNAVVSRFGRKLKKKQLNIQSLTRNTRSSSVPLPKVPNSPERPTKSFDLLAPSKPLKVTVPTITYRRKPKVEKVEVEENKKNMAATVQHSSGPVVSPTPTKPQFIIKYVPTEPTYFLKMAPIKHPEDGKLKYSFDTLVKDIKNMKLPSPTWKIKVVVKSNKIASIIFTNKCVLERTVHFSAKSDYFQIVIENKSAILLGSPSEVCNVEDIEILLNIIHTINANNPMIYYKN